MELLLISNQYPYNSGDSVFIKPEIPYLSKIFDKVHIMCTDSNAIKYDKLDIPNNFILIPFIIRNTKILSFLFKIKNIFITFIHPIKLFYILYNELVNIYKKKRLNIYSFGMALRYLLSANYYAIFLKNYLYKNPEIKIIYTYWFLSEAMAAIFCKRIFNIPIICITRAHGCDIYEFEQKINYQLYKKWMDKYIDYIFFISKNGYNYYLDLFGGTDKFKYYISRLGIENKFVFDNSKITKITNNNIKVFSCSYIVSGKRIHHIIEALYKINDINIEWTHIGNGIDKNKIEMLAKKLLSNKQNIKYNFLGYLENELIKRYLNDNYFDYFVSTSEAEGLPISMMEAISFGIPVIATNVGGVSEIVNKDTGILIDPDNCVDELINAIYHVSSMTYNEKIKLRKSCRENWEKNYMAEKQYTIFINDIKRIMKKCVE